MGRLVVLLMAIIATTTMVSAQIPDCASKLVDCADYLNSTKPPDSCCTPLKEAVIKQHKCLCDLYENPSLLKAFNINITQALELPQYCGVSADVSSCSKVAAPTVSPPPPPPPGVPGNDGSSLSKMTWTGVSSLLLFWVSLMAY
ncbi:hypothetical protein GIB67_013073 [Kingdonia uniflora]|uniref:Bifunctional inhibitor/plant lipid transfer protein/seed storage helical domain-containing protein n=1 Tax=Kingdonia uniflora TaxID=39325 RepID=A0A7J7MCJ7_9MAGN|nr:hypothetical protein GIB67_013073 [Kingdonia uniflora]